MPALESAQEALSALNKNDMSEVKAYSTPPPAVELVLCAVMVLRRCEATWVEAKKQLGNTARDLPCNVRREGGKSLVIGGSSLVIFEGKACNPL